MAAAVKSCLSKNRLQCENLYGAPGHRRRLGNFVPKGGGRVCSCGGGGCAWRKQVSVYLLQDSLSKDLEVSQNHRTKQISHVISHRLLYLLTQKIFNVGSGGSHTAPSAGPVES